MLNQSSDQNIDQAEALKERLYALKQPSRLPKILPESNPQFPKKPATLQRGNQVAAANSHFSQIKHHQFTAVQAEQTKKQDERLIISSFIKPLDAIDRLKTAPEGTFFYMQRADKINQGDMFQYFICPHQLIDVKDYYTISYTGVAHISNQNQSFTPLQEWLDELQKLEKLRKINIFKNFRVWKPLYLLKRAVPKNRRVRSIGLLQQNLFTVNQFLRQSLFVVLECTDGIRSLKVIQTDQFKGKRSVNLLLKNFQDFNFGKILQSDDENGSVFPQESKVHNYPFTIDKFDSLALLRCTELSELFDTVLNIVSTQTRKSIDETILLLFAQSNDDSDDEKTTKTVKTAISYTERASRMNACKRMLNYLRLTDFMIMDSLYDFAFQTLESFKQKMTLAGQEELPTNVVASQAELLQREKEGLYRFGDEEAGEEADEFDEAALNKVLGNSKNTFYLGTIICQCDHYEEPKTNLFVKNDSMRSMLSNLSNASFTAPLQSKVAKGPRELRIADDQETPGNAAQPGQQVSIVLSPSIADFQRSFEGFTESLLSVETSVRRLMNHEDFADISLPVVSGDIQLGLQDGNKLTLLQEINAPDLSVLFTSNIGFSTLLQDISALLKVQYQEALDWSKCLQPFYDAFNDCINLDIGTIENKLFGVVTGSWEGPGKGRNADKDYIEYYEEFNKLRFNSVKDDNNEFLEFQTKIFDVEFKEILAQTSQFSSVKIRTKNDVPLTIFQNLTKITMQELLISDSEFNELLNKMEHYRRLHYSMPEQVNLQLFSFDLSSLKKSFMPVSQRIMDYLRVALPLAVFKRLFLVQANMFLLQKYLNNIPQQIEEFIVYKDVVILIQEEVIDNIKTITDNVLQLLSVCEQHQFKIPKEVLSMQQFFLQNFEVFKQQVNFIEGGLDQHINKQLDSLSDQCKNELGNLTNLATQMRLKSLNRTVDLFTLSDMAQFFNIYMKEFIQRKDQQTEIQNQLTIALSKQEKIGTFPELEKEIETLQAQILPPYMMISPSKLTQDLLLEQHNYYLSNKEIEEEESEEDGLGEEIQEEEEEENEADEVKEAGEENNEETDEQSRPSLDETQKQDIQKLLDKEIPPHLKLSNIFIHLHHRTQKTNSQRAELDKVEEKIKQIQKYQLNLGSEQTDFPLLEKVAQHIRQYDNLWSASLEFQKQQLIISRQNFFGDLEHESLNLLVANIGKIAFQCERSILSSSMPGVLKQRITELRQIIPIVQSLDNPALKDRHWQEVGNALNISVPMQVLNKAQKDEREVPVISINWLVFNKALIYKDQLSQVSNNAANEQNLEATFNKVNTEWQTIDLLIKAHASIGDIFILYDTADLIAKLDDSLLVVQGIASSKYAKPIQEEVNTLLRQLTHLSTCLDVFLKVQKGYLYLLNIFASSDIQRQLPNESKMFQDLDSFWKKLMQKIYEYPQALKVTNYQISQRDENTNSKISVLESQLRRYEQVLEQIQKSLDDFLQTKRMAFPRLFFISDDELLDLLALAKNPLQLNQHMRKLFENVVSVDMFMNQQAGGLEISALNSEEGEKMTLIQTVKPRGSMTVWLTTLEQKMRQTVAKSIKTAVESFKEYKDRGQWILANHAQSVIAGSCTFWCAGISEALDGTCELRDMGFMKTDDYDKKQNPLNQYLQRYENDLQGLIVLIKGGLNKLQRCSVTALATIETHNRDTIQVLLQQKLQTTEDFEFQKLLRYYYNLQDPDVPILLKQNTTILPYQNEYLGASARLVITPLTDLVYLHIACAVQNSKAINLSGPAGTGKSETTKDQNKARGNACVVFNCSDNVEVYVMNRFFMGFCMTGAGSCLDEFNRLELSLLSVIAGSIKQILDGLKMARNGGLNGPFLFQGYEIQLNPDTLIAISLNPGYAGRAELPQNLKNLFRTFSMVVPDYSLISEIILFSQAFTQAKPLSRKVVQLYKLSSEQLSQSNSYDFGMRGTKSVLSMAGNLRRKFVDQTEEQVLIRAMQDSNLPRMEAEDRDLFMGIINDLFPNEKYVQQPNQDLQNCIERSLREHNHQVNTVLMEKINQLFETSQIRHGVLMMGPAKSGKTVSLNTMTEALGYLREMVNTTYSVQDKKNFDSNFPMSVVNKTQIHLINSKAITINEIYGAYDDVSGEWKDGLLGNIMRTSLSDTKDPETAIKQFIMFDSHVSTEWIETMNSLLDDSKLLCLANSERLKINDYISILFECESLKHASPATVSRLGILYYPECTLADTLKIQAINLRPPNFKSLTDDEKTELDIKILKHSVAKSLEQQIVRWDHIVLSWLDSDFDQLFLFKSLKQTSSDFGTEKTIENIIYEKFKGLFIKLISIFVPIGLKYASTVKNLYINTNEYQLVNQILLIFASLLKYNRSMAAQTQLDLQEELNQFAQENGLSDAQKAPDSPVMDQLDFSVFIRFLTLQYVYRNQTILTQPPTPEEVYASILEYILNSEEYKQMLSLIKNLFMFAFIWSFGGTLAAGNKQNREDFDQMVRLQIELQNEAFQVQTLRLQQGELIQDDVKLAPFDELELELPIGVQLSLIPNQGTVFDYYLDWQAFVKQQFEILAAFPHIPIYHEIGEVCPHLVNGGAKSLQLLFQQTEDIIMNLATVSQIFQSGIEEQQQLLQDEAITIPVQFTSFNKLIPEFNYNPNVPFSSVFIETQDTIRYQHLLESLIKNSNNILLTGSSGSGKTSVISSLLSSLDSRLLSQNIQINFSARTSSLRIQQILEDTLEKRRKNLLGPVIGKIGIIYIDDLNLPAKDIYECSQPIEFMRFLLDTGGFYDRRELFFKKISETKVLASCAPPGGGRETITTRLTTSFILLNQPESEDDSLVKIYDQILSSHLQYYKYNAEIISSSTGIVKALIAIYHNLSAILKPTPSKMHYSFTLRDVSKVIQGLLRAPKTIIKQTDDFISLFRHEILRVFGDRTVNSFDRERVCKQIVEVLNTQAGAGLKKALVYEAYFDEDGVLIPNENPPQNLEFLEMWGDYMRMGTPLEERVYEKAKDFKSNSQLMYSYLQTYNDSGAQKMNLILFEDAVFYVNKIAKVLSTERGNLMNVGVGGSGRKSLTRLAAFMCDFDVESIQLKKGYSQQDFHDDVKKLYLKAGIQGKNIVFLLDESQLVSEAILEDINNILNSGLISNLFEADEMDLIMTSTRAFINENNLSDIIEVGNKAAVFNFFINRVRDKLHLVLCLSPSGDEFRARLRTFPSLLTCMSLVWFHPWPQTALQDVSLNILRENLKSVDFSSITENVDPTENQKFAQKLATKLAPLATEIHANTEKLLQQYYMQTNRRHYLPPATFLDLLNIYCSLLQKRITEIATKYNQLQTGVIKLIDAKDQVDVLQLEQEALKPELEKSTISTNELIQQVDKEAVQVNEMRQTAIQDAAIVAAQTKECEMMASDAQKELDACEPIIAMAVKALDSINAGDIAEMKRVSSPTKLVKMVIESIAVLLGCKTDWASCQQMLGQNGFIKVLQQYDKDNISDQMLKKLKVYTQNEDFEPAKIEKVSLACKSLSLWVVAVEKYSYVNREVEPKRQRLSKAKTELDQKQAVLKEKQDKLATVEAQFKVLTDTLNENKSNLDSLQRQMELTKQRLDRAEKLTSALGDERVRWVQQSGELKETLQKVIGDVFLAACGVCYFGVFTSQFRTKLIAYWFGLLQIYEIKTSPQSYIEKGIFNLVSSDEMQVEIWKEFGLPNDQQSIDNAVIIQEVLGMKWPLLIDPQNQGSNFIKELEAANQVMILRPTQPGIVRKFESAIRSGIPILLDGVGEKLDPSLQPIIERQFTIDNGKQMVKLGDQAIEVHPGFRLYITTKLMNPKYSPETHAKLQIINFSIAVDALQQQILGEIIMLEYPDLEKARSELTQESSANKKLLTKLAGQILNELSSFQGSVLDNEGLIQVLNESKATSLAIKEKEIASASTREKISQYYAYYIPVAIRASLIYFLISDMSLVEQMYLFSLSYYKQLVLQEVGKVQEFKAEPDHIEKRVVILIEKLTFNLFTGISRGLFEKDKFVFAFLLGCRILQNNGEIKEEEWGLFTKGSVYSNIYNQDIDKKKQSPETKKLLELLSIQSDMQHKLADQVKVMCQVDYLQDTAKMFLEEYQKIRNYLKQDRNTLNDNLVFIITFDETSKVEHYQFIIQALKQYKTTPFQRLLFVKLLADEYFFIVLPSYIEIILDARFANIKPQPLKQLYLDSTQFAPILFIISEGVDPVASTQLLAEEYKKYFHIISLGKGQTPGVRQLLKTATQDGSWVFLQNVHLAQSDFLPELEVIIESLAASKQGQIISQLDYLTLSPNPGFRLYLSSTPVDYFPQSVLQASLKCTTEPPSGMKNNLLRQFGSIDEDKFNLASIMPKMPAVFDQDGITATWKRIVFSCMFFHSNLLERKKFGPQGYNLHYDFNDTDIEMCLLQLEDFFLKEFKAPSAITQDLFISLDWHAVEFIFGAIHYGGKVNDSWDKRAVATILRKIITDKIVKQSDSVLQPYNFVEQDDRYSLSFINSETKLSDVIEKLQSLPPVDQTVVFGMSENSAVVNQQAETSRILDRILSVSADCVKAESSEQKQQESEKPQVQTQEQGDKTLTAQEQQKILKDSIKTLNIKIFGVEVKSITVDEIVDNLANNLLKILPKQLDINEANPKSITYDENNVPHCLTTILKQEMDRFNQLLTLLQSTLTNVRLAIKGDVILSSDLESIYKSLYDGKVPVIWGSIAYPSLKPLAPWFEDLILRVTFIRSWLTNGRPISYWLSGLYFPQGFCTALLQTHARKYKIAVDSLRFDFNYSHKEWIDYKGSEIVQEDLVKDATWIHGLFLDCGYFDLETQKLVEPKLGILYPKLPYIRFTPVESKNQQQVGYTSPVYRTSQRAGVLSSTGHSTNFVLPLIIPSEFEEDRYVRLGTAALCGLDD